MQKQERLVIKQIGSKMNMRENLPKYGAFMSRIYLEYSMIQLAMNLYTFRERIQEYSSRDSYVEEAFDAIQKLTGRYVLERNYDNRGTDRKEIHEIRSRVTAKMRILTSYTDALQIYEYILNRLEYSEEAVEEEIDTEAYAGKIFRYLFQDEDKMVINSKIQMVVEQLPIRMTKSRFYDILNESLRIYTGSECSTVDDFAETIRSCSGLYKPEGFETEYPELFQVLNALEQLDYQNLSREEWEASMERLEDTADYIDELVTDYLLLEDVVNELYAVMTAGIYVEEETKEMGYAAKALECVLEAMANDTVISEVAEDCFFALEGSQEALGEKLMQGEGVLFDVWSGEQELLKESELLEEYADLNLISKLLCSSIFIDLKPDSLEPELADSIYINQVRDRLVEEFSASFAAHDKRINRARMAMVLGVVPVFFNSQQEISDYLNYALAHCNNSRELKAVTAIIDEMMEQDG
ncbi:MAG: hypothetical protein NC089_00055 [Bacteroides sp.]|nr:hypothetical protein [Bacteroides sp.]MCM1549396.1 hypothetical protein [Clostridium sp.]